MTPSCYSQMTKKECISANVIPFTIHDGKMEILLIRERSSGKKDGKWSCPGGWVEKNETLLDSASRELYEETSSLIRIIDSDFYRRMKRKQLHQTLGGYYTTRKSLIPYSKNPLSASFTMYIPYSYMTTIVSKMTQNEEISEMKIMDLSSVLFQAKENPELYRDCFLSSLNVFTEWLERNEFIFSE